MLWNIVNMKAIINMEMLLLLMQEQCRDMGLYLVKVEFEAVFLNKIIQLRSGCLAWSQLYVQK